jgi:hypothetical protein
MTVTMPITPLESPQTSPAAPRESPRRRLAVVPSRSQRRARPRSFYAVVTVATVGLIVVVQLLLSIAVSNGAYQLQGLQDKSTTLARDYQAVSEQVNSLKSPQNLAANAAALGMVVNANPTYLRLSDGSVLGAPGSAYAPNPSTNLIPNSLLSGLPLAASPTKDANGQPVQPASKDPGANQGAPGSNDQQAKKGPVPLDGALPAPTTH